MEYKDFYMELFEYKSQHITPEFKAWFKNSKVVDSDGNPLRVYHGTSKDKDFSKFKDQPNGIWFTASPKEASAYAKQNDSMVTRYDPRDGFTHKNTSARVIPVYLSIQNPAKLTDEQLKQLKYATNYRKAQREVFGGLKSQGYDGIIFSDQFGLEFGDSVFAVFSPSQIKSAMSNSGKFDPSDHNIGK